MSRLIESIRLCDGQFSRLDLHQARLNNSFQMIFGKESRWNLESILKARAIPDNGLYKCRVVYDEKDIQIEFGLYQTRSVQSLKLIVDDDMDYSHKWKNRGGLDKAFAKRGKCDDILIIKSGTITDTLYANIAFQKGNKWYTPQSYLLPGTMRQFLLNTGVIEECEITERNFREFDRFRLINAMLEWDSPAFDVSNIY
jgi:4-amino-4-deoxychorismate lyase